MGLHRQFFVTTSFKTQARRFSPTKSCHIKNKFYKTFFCVSIHKNSNEIFILNFFETKLYGILVLNILNIMNSFPQNLSLQNLYIITLRTFIRTCFRNLGVDLIKLFWSKFTYPFCKLDLFTEMQHILLTR
jgi:hypothetical protein